MQEITILKECLNYDTIMDYNYQNSDFITDNIINVYQEQIFGEKKNINKIKFLDKVVLEYIKNINFQKFVKNYYLDDNINHFVKDDLKIIELYDKYKLNRIINKNTNRWI